MAMISVGCGGKKDEPAPEKKTAPVAESKGSDSSVQAKKMNGTPGKTTPVKDHGDLAPDIELPKGTGKPPVKTTKAIDDAKAKALTDLTFAGFTKTVPKQTTGLEVSQKTESRPHINVTVKITPCDAKNPCEAIDLAKWKDKPELKKYFGDKLKDLKDNVFEVTDATLNGTKFIRTYQVAYKIGKDERGNQEGGFSYNVVDYYNDGTNGITVVAEYKDQLPTTRDALLKLVTKDELMKSADAFLDVYTQNW